MHKEMRSWTIRSSFSKAVRMCQNENRAVLVLLLAPDEDCADMALALRCVTPGGVTVLGHAVAWGYDEALPPLLAAAR